MEGGDRDPFFLVAPPPPMYAASRPAKEHDQESAARLDQVVPSDDVLTRARMLLQSFPIAMPPIRERDVRKSKERVCSSEQLAAMERITKLTDVFAGDSPVADWLLMRPYFGDEKSQNISLDDRSLRSGFVAQMNLRPEMHVEHTFESVVSSSAEPRERAVLLTPNYHLESHNSILGTVYQPAPENSDGSGGGELHTPRFSRFAMYLPSATAFFITILPEGLVALDRSVHGAGRQAAHESIIIDSEGKILCCLFGELVCQYCAAFNSRRTQLGKCLVYPRCTCPKSVQERLWGPRVTKSYSSWTALTNTISGIRDFALGIHIPEGDSNGNNNPWMFTSLRAELFAGRNDAIAAKLRTGMIQSLEVPIARLERPMICGVSHSDSISLSSHSFRGCDPTHSCALCILGATILPKLTKPKTPKSPDVKQRKSRKICSICGASFAQTGNLTRHMQRMHTKQNIDSKDGILVKSDFKCAFCDASFSSAANLSRHTRVGHRGMLKLK